MKEKLFKGKRAKRMARAAAVVLAAVGILSSTAVLPVRAAQDLTTISETSERVLKLDVSKMHVAQNANQLCIVSAEGTTANVSLHNRGTDGWYEVFSCKGYIGANGLGKTIYGDKKTPVGIYHFTQAFGIKPNPGTRYFKYYQVDDRYYWLGDTSHPYFNELVVSNKYVDGEHIIDYGKDYNYVLAIDYNSKKDAYKGSAIFFHVESGGPTAGCVSMPETNMVQLITNARQDCVVVIDSPERMAYY